MQNNSIPHSISLTEAIQLTSHFQADRPADMPICETFEKTSVLAMLAVEGAEKFRIYYGKKENGEICAVLVAADAAGYDILPPTYKNEQDNSGEQEDPLLLENSYKCPPTCPPESPLRP
ncbi:MAG: hypothetical protein ACK4S0_04575 [Sediminibacterium sp.]